MISELYVYTASLRRVVDGDTVDLEIDLGFGASYKDRFRIARINAPESRTRDKLEKARGVGIQRVFRKRPRGS